MKANFHNLFLCLEILKNEFSEFEDLEKRRERYEGVYKLLKLASVSAINLMDMECPSLKPLNIEDVIQVEQLENRLKIF